MRSVFLTSIWPKTSHPVTNRQALPHHADIQSVSQTKYSTLQSRHFAKMPTLKSGVFGLRDTLNICVMGQCLSVGHWVGCFWPNTCQKNRPHSLSGGFSSWQHHAASTAHQMATIVETFSLTHSHLQTLINMV